MLWIGPTGCKLRRSPLRLCRLVWQRVLHDRFALWLHRLSRSQLHVVLGRSAIPDSMQVTSELHGTPRIHLPVQWCTLSLHPPPPHILVVCKLCTVEHITALQPFQGTKPVDFTNGEFHKRSPPFANLPRSLYSGCCVMHWGKRPGTPSSVVSGSWCSFACHHDAPLLAFSALQVSTPPKSLDCFCSAVTCGVSHQGPASGRTHDLSRNHRGVFHTSGRLWQQW